MAAFMRGWTVRQGTTLPCFSYTFTGWILISAIADTNSEAPKRGINGMWMRIEGIKTELLRRSNFINGSMKIAAVGFLFRSSVFLIIGGGCYDFNLTVPSPSIE